MLAGLSFIKLLFAGVALQKIQQRLFLGKSRPQGAALFLQKALFDGFVQQRQQRIEIATQIQQDNGLAVPPQLPQRQDLKQLVKGADTARNRQR